MGLATFKGGVHPYEGKELSENQPIEVLMPKGEMVYPVSQHIGAPAKPFFGRTEDRRGWRLCFRECNLLRVRHGKSSGAPAGGRRSHGEFDYCGE